MYANMLISALLRGWKCTRAGFLNSLEAGGYVPSISGLLDAALAIPRAPKVRHACKFVPPPEMCHIQVHLRAHWILFRVAFFLETVVWDPLHLGFKSQVEWTKDAQGIAE